MHGASSTIVIQVELIGFEEQLNSQATCSYIHACCLDFKESIVTLELMRLLFQICLRVLLPCYIGLLKPFSVTKQGAVISANQAMPESRDKSIKPWQMSPLALSARSANLLLSWGIPLLVFLGYEP